MIELMANTIGQFNMIEEGDRVIVGVSGGADSLCLLLNLLEYQKKVHFSLEVVHVNHMIREEAHLDAEFVERICKSYDIPFYLHTVDVEAMAKERHMSTEETGRIARYEAFRSHNPNKIAVGHHSDDVAETVLHNMCRGTGLHGIAGVKPVSGEIIRPMINLSRKDIEDYLDSINQEYCTDATNNETEYTRNKIRLNIIPYMEENINNQTARHIADMAGDVRDALEYIDREVSASFEKVVKAESDERIEVDIKSFSFLDDYIKKEIILRIFDRFHRGRKDITRAHVESVISVLEASGEKQLDFPYGIKVVKQYDDLIFTTEEDKKQEIKSVALDFTRINTGETRVADMPDGSTFEYRITEYKRGMEVPSGDWKKWLDYDKIKCQAELRIRQSGDYLTIDDGMHKKSLKSYLIDCKISKSDRDNLMILADGNHVMWVPGLRISSFYKISEQTKTVLEVNITRKGEE